MKISIAQRLRSALTLRRSTALMIGAGLCTGIAALALMFIPEQGHTPIAVATSLSPIAAALVNAESGVSWTSLSDFQRTTLRPLRDSWPRLDSREKQRWLNTATHLHGLSAEAKARVDARMVAWAKLTPRNRAQVRLQYIYAKRIPAAERKTRWRTYRSIPKGPLPIRLADATLVLVAPAMVQVGPGATTVLITELPGT